MKTFRSILTFLFESINVNSLEKDEGDSLPGYLSNLKSLQNT